MRGERRGEHPSPSTPTSTAPVRAASETSVPGTIRTGRAIDRRRCRPRAMERAGGVMVAVVTVAPRSCGVRRAGLVADRDHRAVRGDLGSGVGGGGGALDFGEGVGEVGGEALDGVGGQGADGGCFGLVGEFDGDLEAADFGGADGAGDEVGGGGEVADGFVGEEGVFGAGAGAGGGGPGAGDAFGDGDLEAAGGVGGQGGGAGAGDFEGEGLAVEGAAVGEVDVAVDGVAGGEVGDGLGEAGAAGGHGGVDVAVDGVGGGEVGDGLGEAGAAGGHGEFEGAVGDVLGVDGGGGGVEGGPDADAHGDQDGAADGGHGQWSPRGPLLASRAPDGAPDSDGAGAGGGRVLACHVCLPWWMPAACCGAMRQDCGRCLCARLPQPQALLKASSVRCRGSDVSSSVRTTPRTRMASSASSRRIVAGGSASGSSPARASVSSSAATAAREIAPMLLADPFNAWARAATVSAPPPTSAGARFLMLSGTRATSASMSCATRPTSEADGSGPSSSSTLARTEMSSSALESDV